MLSKNLVIAGVVFQIAGIIWDFIFHVRTGGVGEFFETAHWPIFLGFVLILVAVLQSFPRKPKEPEPNKNNPFLP